MCVCYTHDTIIPDQSPRFAPPSDRIALPLSTAVSRSQGPEQFEHRTDDRSIFDTDHPAKFATCVFALIYGSLLSPGSGATLATVSNNVTTFAAVVTATGN